MRSRKSADARLPEGDDGRTIVDMNVEGMPWYTPRQDAFGQGAVGRGTVRRGAAGQDACGPHAAGQGIPRQDVPLTREQARFFTWGALKAALLVTGAMCAGIMLFVLFCQFVWFR